MLKCVKQAIERWPNFQGHGIVGWKGEARTAQEVEYLESPLFEAEVEKAVVYLSQFNQRKTPDHSWGNSYGVKHRAERMPPRSYISNGAAIVAALHLGLRVEPLPGSPNAVIYVGRKRKVGA